MVAEWEMQLMIYRITPNSLTNLDCKIRRQDSPKKGYTNI